MHALNVPKDQITIPPRSSISISVGTQDHHTCKGVVEGDQHLFINHEIHVARGIAKLRESNARLTLMNFSNKYKHVIKRMTVANIENILEASNAFTFTNSSESTPIDSNLSTSFQL